MAHLALDKNVVSRCRELADKIAKPIENLIDTHTTVAIERSVLRLLGVEGAIQQGGGQWFPEVNIIVEDLRRESVLSHGVLHWFVNGMIQTKMTARELGTAVALRKVNLTKLARSSEKEIHTKARDLCESAKQNLIDQREKRDHLRKRAKRSF